MAICSESPSTRRAWIEIVALLCYRAAAKVALHPEGVVRKQIVTLDFWT